MKVVFRADAGVLQGTGHVMRCLTLAEELGARGHETHLLLGGKAPAWLLEKIGASSVILHPCTADILEQDSILSLRPDWVVVDSYRIDATEISRLNPLLPVLAIVDGDARGIEATLYLDQNLGAEAHIPMAIGRTRFLAGSGFALIRSEVLEQRRRAPWEPVHARPSVLSFMGGTDPTLASSNVVAALIAVRELIDLTVVAPISQHSTILDEWGSEAGLTLLAPTPDLPALFGKADIVVSAAGTSAWDICSLGVPSVLIAVVSNQTHSLEAAVSSGIALGVDAVSDSRAIGARLPGLVRQLLDDVDLRRMLSEHCLKIFDGNGASRVVDALEAFGQQNHAREAGR